MAASTLTRDSNAMPKYWPRTIDLRSNFGSAKKAASRKMSSMLVDAKTIVPMPKSDKRVFRLIFISYRQCNHWRLVVVT